MQKMKKVTGKIKKKNRNGTFPKALKANKESIYYGVQFASQFNS